MCFNQIKKVSLFVCVVCVVTSIKISGFLTRRIYTVTPFTNNIDLKSMNKCTKKYNKCITIKKANLGAIRVIGKKSPMNAKL